MNHEAIKELLGAYALNAVEPDEAAVVEAHATTCSDCRSELENYLEVAALLPASLASAPSELWDAIAGEIGSERAFNEPAIRAVEGSEGAATPGSNVVPLRRRWLRPLAIAAAFVLVAAAAVVQSVRLGAANDDLADERATVVALSDQIDQPVLDVAVSQAMENPLAQQVRLGSEVSGSNAIIVLMPDGTGYLAEHTLQPLPADRTYQLWAIVDGKVISAGVLGPEPGVVPFHIDPEGFEGFAITDEVVGGVPASENSPVVAWLAA
ncbi:MAG: anti-sigma factor [Acidimicrobiia bacterium]|nr:anti-sigma factor [Acidimicrobiia bacterium]